MATRTRPPGYGTLMSQGEQGKRGAPGPPGDPTKLLEVLLPGEALTRDPEGNPARLQVATPQDIHDIQATATAAASAAAAAQATANDAVPSADRGAPNGVAPLDGDGKLSADAVPSSVAGSSALAAEAAARRLGLAADPNLLVAGTITRDANGAATAAAVTWPDGTPGQYTATTVSSTFPGAVDAYTITYGSPVTKTYTQPAVTRNALGAVTNRPSITVATS